MNWVVVEDVKEEEEEEVLRKLEPFVEEVIMEEVEEVLEASTRKSGMGAYSLVPQDFQER